MDQNQQEENTPTGVGVQACSTYRESLSLMGT